MAAQGAAAARWRAQVRARLAETRRLRVRAGFERELWGPRRARRFARAVGIAGADDALLRALLGEDAATYLDIGAGSGRHAVALARAGRSVTCVEPSEGMRRILERHRAPRLRVVAAGWPAPVERADVAYASHVLFLVEDAPAFLRAMTRASRRRCYLVLAALHADAIADPLWRHFHGRQRRPSPTFLDALALLSALGQRPQAALLPQMPAARYASVAAAVPRYREDLALADTPALRRELRRVLAAWLVERDGALEPPVSPMPVLIRWAPRLPL